MHNPKTEQPLSQLPILYRGNHDPAKREAAARLNAKHPAWLVLYSLHRRQFCAIAAWPAPEPLTLWARTIEDLAQQMHATMPVVPRPRVFQDAR
ncbi:hypothetical protein Misp01_10910 [Microtetraspora sp. NBRC 13810]|uniref:hypothetical protein n=1 Tax=Microtetraspora sp. NBRC 13810 TaxID=3030990 RepID=UPI00249FEC86|nr:hypothetical protein [Microtetraspora sp. NBRC 13810]GLW05961.1 hypothetical protein Misp01_10910 [Microtetraspora sp. NBRC 13810]